MKCAGLLLIFFSLFLSACGGSGGGSPESASVNEYAVYEEDALGAAGLSSEAAVNSSGRVVVLPATANAPANYNAVSNANVTFIQEEKTSDADDTASSITITTDADGRFVIPDEVLNDSQGEGGGVDVVVSAAGGALSAGTSLPSAGKDKGESPLSLGIIPGEFKMVEGELRVFHAVKTTPEGKAVRAKNATWDCDPDEVGVLSLVEEAANGEYVICRAETAGISNVSAALAAGGGLEAAALGEVVSQSELIAVEGAISLTNGTAVGSGFLVSFAPEEGAARLHFAGHTDDAGAYRAFLPAAQVPTTYKVLIGTPRELGARLHKAVPFDFTVNAADTGKTLTADFAIGEPLTPLPPRPPVARIIRTSWHQVNSAARPRYFEPLNGIRVVLANSPDGPGRIEHAGMFRGWCYEKTGASMTITPPPPLGGTCPDGLARMKVEITRASVDHYTWSKFVRPPGGQEFLKIAEGDVFDTVSYSSPIPEAHYISDIAATAWHYAPGLLGKVLFTNTWDWTRTLGGGEPGADEEAPETIDMMERACSGNNEWTGLDPHAACGVGVPLGTYFVTRSRAAAFEGFSNTVTPLFNFYGTATHYVRRPDGSIRKVADTVCSGAVPCVINTDGSGEAEVASVDGRVNVLFTLLPFNSPDVIAEGTLSILVSDLEGADVEKVFKFAIARSGLITITRPDGARESFPLHVF